MMKVATVGAGGGMFGPHRACAHARLGLGFGLGLGLGFALGFALGLGSGFHFAVWVSVLQSIFMQLLSAC